MLRNVSLNNLKYKREALLEKITENRDQHERDYKEARALYRTAVREDLAKRLADWERGVEVDNFVHLPKPVQYLRDYDRAIAQLKFTTIDEIELDSVTFAQLVLDEWSWKSEFELNTKSYAGGPRVG